MMLNDKAAVRLMYAGFGVATGVDPDGYDVGGTSSADPTTTAFTPPPPAQLINRQAQIAIRNIQIAGGNQSDNLPGPGVRYGPSPAGDNSVLKYAAIGGAALLLGWALLR